MVMGMGAACVRGLMFEDGKSQLPLLVYIIYIFAFCMKEISFYA